MANTIGTVGTKYGLVTGVELGGKYEGITLFKGIPYAKPPIGELRFKPPVDPQPWSGVRACVNEGPVCTQPTNGDLDAEPWATDFYYMGNPPQSEDCLYMNIATGAAMAGEKRPVFMWFHGGGSDHGYYYEAEFDPAELARKGIVVVSVGHRLNAFGYLALPQLSAEQGGKSGNYILLDNMKALEWVIENIDAFGGDPECITVGGQSAGTGKSCALSFSPLAKGHIKRVINQSGLAWTRNNKELAAYEQECRKFLQDNGIDPDLPVEELRKIDGLEFLPKSRGVRAPWSLVCDGDAVPFVMAPDGMVKFGRDYDYLAGTNLGETQMKPGAARGELGYTSAAEFYASAREMLGDLYDKYDFENLVKVTDENVDRESRRLASYGLVKGARIGGLAYNRYFGAKRAEVAPEKNTFNYLFTRVAPQRPEDSGTARDGKLLMSWHSNELWYMFNSLREGTPPARPWEDADFDLADLMSSYWANFIKTGDPNGEGLPLWPKGDGSLGLVELGEEVVPVTYRGALDDLLMEFVATLAPLPEC